MTGSRGSERNFVAVAALLFAGCAAVTIAHCLSMPATGDMPMLGDWPIAAAWGRTCGQTWLGAAASFLAMWTVMMMAMMLPSLVPMLWRYRRATGGAGGARLDGLTALVGLGYLFVWLLAGMLAYALGLAQAAIELQIELHLPALAGALPVAAGLLVLGAGALQFTPWKARHLAHCRAAPGEATLASGAAPAGISAAWRHGLRLGLHCACSCIGLTLVLLVVGIMDLRAMIVVTAAITLERLAPEGQRVAQGIGAVVIGAGMVLIARAAGFGG